MTTNQINREMVKSEPPSQVVAIEWETNAAPVETIEIRRINGERRRPQDVTISSRLILARYRSVAGSQFLTTA